MIRNLLIIFLGLLICAIHLPAYGKDVSLRCGDSLIVTGDSRARVLLRCGEPYLRETIGYIRSTDYGERVEFTLEAWTYDSTPDMFKIITFKGNRVLSIETENK